jgi:hypothetical protein
MSARSVVSEATSQAPRVRADRGRAAASGRGGRGGKGKGGSVNENDARAIANITGGRGASARAASSSAKGGRGIWAAGVVTPMACGGDADPAAQQVSSSSGTACGMCLTPLVKDAG